MNVLCVTLGFTFTWSNLTYNQLFLKSLVLNVALHNNTGNTPNMDSLNQPVDTEEYYPLNSLFALYLLKTTLGINLIQSELVSVLTSLKTD